MKHAKRRHRLSQLFIYDLTIDAFRSRPGNHHQCRIRFQQGLQAEAKAFAHHSFNPIALHRVPDPLGNRDSEARLKSILQLSQVNHKMDGLVANALALNLQELPAMVEPVSAFEAGGC